MHKPNTPSLISECCSSSRFRFHAKFTAGCPARARLATPSPALQDAPAAPLQLNYRQSKDLRAYLCPVGSQFSRQRNHKQIIRCHPQFGSSSVVYNNRIVGYRQFSVKKKTSKSFGPVLLGAAACKCRLRQRLWRSSLCRFDQAPKNYSSLTRIFHAFRRKTP